MHDAGEPEGPDNVLCAIVVVASWSSFASIWLMAAVAAVLMVTVLTYSTTPFYEKGPPTSLGVSCVFFGKNGRPLSVHGSVGLHV